jgi:sugar/nucleoside kinase (ribokinase family)
MTYDVYGVGNSLVDIQAQVTEATVTALGFPKGSMTLVDEAVQTKVLGGVAGVPFHRCAGGSAANTILGIADFGGKTVYAGKTADDELGKFFLEDMRRMGVAIEVPPAAGQTGTCVILITPDAQRTMLTHLGVSVTLGPDDIDRKQIAQSKYVYVEGYLFAGPTTRDAALLAIAEAKAAGVKVAFTISDPFLIADHRDEFWELIQGPVDLLFCNLEEARSLTGLEDAVDCAREIHRHAASVALTLGANGSIVMHEGEVLPIEGVPVEAIDTTGAGDMYAAGLLYGITAGFTWRSAGRLASHAAARVVSQLGARLKRPFTAAEIADLLR